MHTDFFVDPPSDSYINTDDGFMGEDEALKLADALSIVNAACCIVGINPSFTIKDGLTDFDFHSTSAGRPAKMPFGQTDLTISAICSAIKTEKLTPAHLEHADTESSKDTFYNIWETLIDVDELKRWLLSRNCKPPFFFGDEASSTPSYLEDTHPHYSPQIAAAIQAWEAIQDPELRKGKSVKGAATEWLETNYRALGLVHNGERNNNAITRIATLVNWETSGGAPKTPE